MIAFISHQIRRIDIKFHDNYVLNLDALKMLDVIKIKVLSLKQTS
jgi:hypothetical protein